MSGEERNGEGRKGVGVDPLLIYSLSSLPTLSHPDVPPLFSPPLLIITNTFSIYPLSDVLCFKKFPCFSIFTKFFTFPFLKFSQNPLLLVRTGGTWPSFRAVLRAGRSPETVTNLRAFRAFSSSPIPISLFFSESQNFAPYFLYFP